MTGSAFKTRGGKTLKYADLAASLRQQILAGVWPVGSKLPTESELAGASAFSLTTVRRAYQALVEDGLVERRRGAGSFVAAWRADRARSEYVIGVMVPETGLYYDRVIQGIQDHLASTRSGSALLSTYEWDAAREKQALKTLIDAKVDALILTPNLPRGHAAYEVLDQLHQLSLPIVLAERNAAWAGPRGVCEHVVSDHRGGAFDAVQYLHSLGHTKIGLVYRNTSHTTPGILEGYRLACSEANIPIWEESMPAIHWRMGAPPPADLDKIANHVLQSDLTAVLVFSDREGGALQNALIRAGVRIPEDIAMVSYDDENADIAPVPLTAIAPPKYQLGRMAAELVLHRLRGGEESPIQQVTLRPKLVVRTSCGGSNKS